MRTGKWIFIIVFIHFIQGNICNAQNRKLTLVKVEIVNLDIESIADISCDAFDHSLKEEKKVKVFNAKQDISKFQSLTKWFEPVFRKSIDVRGKILYDYGNHSEYYCFDKFGIFYKDGRQYFNRKLLIYILDKMYIYAHPKYLDTLRRP